MASDDELAQRFTYHPPTPAKAQAHTTVREVLEQAARVIRDVTPASREQSLALTKLEEAMFWGNAAIAREP